MRCDICKTIHNDFSWYTYLDTDTPYCNECVIDIFKIQEVVKLNELEKITNTIKILEEENEKKTK